jgi:hypothetical protein
MREAMSRPTMRFVPVKTAEQQAALMMVSRSADPQSHAASDKARQDTIVTVELKSTQRDSTGRVGNPV